MNSNSKVMMISADCHAGALSGTYNDYMPKKYHAAADAWWLEYAREMVIRRGTFFDQEASEAYDEVLKPPLFTRLPVPLFAPLLLDVRLQGLVLHLV